MAGILFLYPKEVEAEYRKQIWKYVKDTSRSELVMDLKKLEGFTNTANYIITHREEYNSFVLDKIGKNISIVVFTGQFTNRTIKVDDKREKTYWLSLNMLRPPDPLLIELFEFMSRTQEPDKITDHIKSKVYEFFGVRNKIRDISPYLLLGKDNLTKPHLQKFEELNKSMEKLLDGFGNWMHVAKRYL